MEQNIAILIADLAGYTALTETHGASTAADLIDKYIEIVEASLASNCHLHERVGDEVIIVSSSPGQLALTALQLIQNCLREDNFLQLHGGLHYGKVLKRKNHYFGTTINVASRIASKADKGSIWCSSEFLNALEDKSAFTFEAKGMHQFKNVNEEIEVFELVTRFSKTFYIDPVCRMLIHQSGTVTHHPYEKNVFFCSPHCLQIYMRDNLEV